MFLVTVLWFCGLPAGILSSIGRTRLKVEGLCIFEHELPYGAMLAVKEAKDAGLHDFMIHYPVRQTEFANDDPIITAFDNDGDLRMVFHWEDGKIYD